MWIFVYHLKLQISARDARTPLVSLLVLLSFISFAMIASLSFTVPLFRMACYPRSSFLGSHELPAMLWSGGTTSKAVSEGNGACGKHQS